MHKHSDEILMEDFEGMVYTADLGEGIFLIDSEALGMKHFCSSYVLTSGDEHVLVETGPSTTRGSLLDGIHNLGFDLGSFSPIAAIHPSHIITLIFTTKTLKPTTNSNQSKDKRKVVRGRRKRTLKQNRSPTTNTKALIEVRYP